MLNKNERMEKLNNAGINTGKYFTVNLPEGLAKNSTITLSINENADPDVQTDLSRIMDGLVREGEPYYDHTIEGLDDMPAHAKSSLFGVSLTIPITNGRLNLGTWQGIYLCEFRNNGGERKIVATIYG